LDTCCHLCPPVRQGEWLPVSKRLELRLLSINHVTMLILWNQVALMTSLFCSGLCFPVVRGCFPRPGRLDCPGQRAETHHGKPYLNLITQSEGGSRKDLEAASTGLLWPQTSLPLSSLKWQHSGFFKASMRL
jgi:hypothetical protein